MAPKSSKGGVTDSLSAILIASILPPTGRADFANPLCHPSPNLRICQWRREIRRVRTAGIICRLEDVSTAVGFNATYFSTLFKKETGQNFMDYLTELRISKAKELLCGEELSVQDVAEQVGYRDLKYFSRLFKKLTGVSPSDYKKLYK